MTPHAGLPAPIVRAAGWYRVLLLLYPRGFRSGYGELLVQAFRDRARDAFCAGGSLALAGFWLAIFSDLAQTVPSEHAASFGGDVEVAYTAIVSALRRTIAAIVMLAIPIAAAIVLFGIVDVVWLAPIPFAKPSSLVRIAETGTNDVSDARLSYRKYLSLARDHRSLAQVGTMAPVPSAVDPSSISVPTYGLRISPSLFAILDMRTTFGRLFTAGDRNVAVISDRLWHTRFGSSANTLGATLHVGKTPLRIVGILAARASFVDPTIDVYFPLNVDPAIVADPGAQIFPVLARLRRGVSLLSAARRLAKRGFVALPYDLTVAPATRIALFMALALVVLSLVGAYVTVVARGLTHDGMTLGRRAAFVHGGAISLASGLIALAVAVPIVRSLDTITADTIPHLRDFAIDAPLVGFAALVIVVTALAVSARLSSPRRFLARRIVRVMTFAGVAGQVGFASLLTIVAMLGIGHLRSVAAKPLGFDPRHLYVATLTSPGRRYADDTSLQRLAPQLVGALEADGNVDAATVATGVPFSGVDMQINAALTARQAVSRGSLYELASVLPNYFAVMKIPLIGGRTFDGREVGGTRALVVSRSFATQFFGRRGAVGRSLRLDPTRPASTIVGVVGDVARRADAAPPPAIYWPRAHLPTPFVTVVVRSDSGTATVAGLIERHVMRLDPTIGVTDVRPLSRDIAKSLATLWFETWLLIGSAAFALLLAVSLLTDGVLDVPRRLAIVPGVLGAAGIALGLQPLVAPWFVVSQAQVAGATAVAGVSLLAIFFLCARVGSRSRVSRARPSLGVRA